MDHPKISSETQKPLPAVPNSNAGLKKDDDQSDESVFIIQQAEADTRKSTKSGSAKARNGERCQRLNDLWGRKEPWSGV